MTSPTTMMKMSYDDNRRGVTAAAAAAAECISVSMVTVTMVTGWPR